MKFTLALAAVAAQGTNIEYEGFKFNGNTSMNNGSYVGNYTMQDPGNNTIFQSNYTVSEDMQSGKYEQIQAVSDYLFYGLDAWGKENRNSTNPQCSDNNACNKIGRNACCASIHVENIMQGQSNYIFRCLNTGIAEAAGRFTLRNMLQVDVKCEQGNWSSASKLAAGVVATSAMVASMF